MIVKTGFLIVNNMFLKEKASWKIKNGIYVHSIIVDRVLRSP